MGTWTEFTLVDIHFRMLLILLRKSTALHWNHTRFQPTSMTQRHNNINSCIERSPLLDNFLHEHILCLLRYTHIHIRHFRALSKWFLHCCLQGSTIAVTGFYCVHFSLANSTNTCKLGLGYTWMTTNYSHYTTELLCYREYTHAIINQNTVHWNLPMVILHQGHWNYSWP